MISEPGIDIGQKAELNLKGLVKTLYKLLIIKNKQFDLIVAPGTTGAFVCKLVEIIYHKLNVPFPSRLVLPIVRYKAASEIPENLFDISVLLPDVIEQLRGENTGSLKEILFVDDEMYGGNALRESLKLCLKYKAEQGITDGTFCTIVAEDQGGTHNFVIPGVIFNFEFFEQGIDEYSNAITYFIPSYLEDPIAKALGGQIGTHAVVNILFDLPIRPKASNRCAPVFSFEFHELAKEKVPNFEELQKEAQEYTSKLIDKYIAEVKSSSVD